MRKKNIISIALSVVFSVVFVAAAVNAATTIGTNISTGGTLTVTGNASTTLFSAYGPVYFGATATSTFSSAGVLTLASPLGVGSGGTGLTSATAGYALIGNSASALQATSTLFVSSASYVGIGTTTPNNLLQVYDLIDFNNTDYNAKLGYQAGKNIVTGANQNTFLGYQAGYASSTASTISADFNTAIGYKSLYSNTVGSENAALGWYALRYNTTGAYNTAIGGEALQANTTGVENVALGMYALQANTTSDYNTAIGAEALANTTGANNTALGYMAGDSITTGANNIIIGYNVDAPLNAGSNQMTIGNLIFGTGIDGTAKTISSGNVGIGTSTPATKLEVHAATGTTTVSVISEAASTGSRIILEDSDGAGCTEIYALNGTLISATVACPAN